VGLRGSARFPKQALDSTVVRELCVQDLDGDAP